MAKALTAAAVEKIKADPEKRIEIPDGFVVGLYLVVQPSGKKSWAARYRSHGKPKKLTLGAFPALDLAGARDAARTALRAVQEGADPAAAKQHERETADLRRFDTVVRSFLARYAAPKNRSWKETARQLGLAPDKGKIAAAADTKVADALANDPALFAVLKGSPIDKWGHRPVTTIDRADVLAHLDSIVDRGAGVQANRAFAALRKLFNWTVERTLLAASPCEGLKPPTAEKSRDRVLSDDETRALWIACDAIGWPFGPLVKLLVLTGQRRDEVAGMRWEEVSGDLWTIPRERAKNDTTHLVPLSDATRDALSHAHQTGDIVFTTTGTTPVSGFSRAKRTLDAEMLKALRKQAAENGGDPEVITLAPWRLHDIRRTVATGMAKNGAPIHVVEKVLNHVSGTFGGVTGVYQRHDFADEKRAALQAWAVRVDRIVNQKPGDNVVALHPKAAGAQS
ncbi:tyrosine-type recombinase/integrase [Pseudochelatococcus lubricantis]|uniref:tyrosine-type recombinase/integrase n=1 Tax=Pseudochelatococcus lubricantis TaxID=1538102 RepID=UPI0035EEF864